MSERPKNAPPNATPYGLIAYRLDEAADAIYDLDPGLASRLHGIMDDLVALNMGQRDRDERIIRATRAHQDAHDPYCGKLRDGHEGTCTDYIIAVAEADR